MTPVPPSFFVWALWRRRGGIPSERPSGLPKRIPKLWQTEYVRRGYRPIPRPQPAHGPFTEPGLWLSWAIRSNGWTAVHIATLAVAEHARWIALDATIDDNLAAFPAIRDACTAMGVTAGLWGTINSAAEAAWRCNDGGASFYVAQNEALGQVEPGFPRLFAAAAPRVELAQVVGPFDGLPHPALDPHGWEAWTKPWTGLPILLEAYVRENPGSTPLAMAAEAAHRGFSVRACVVEANKDHGWELDAYDPAELRRFYGRAVSLYLAESASAASLARFAEWSL